MLLVLACSLPPGAPEAPPAPAAGSAPAASSPTGLSSFLIAGGAQPVASATSRFGPRDMDGDGWLSSEDCDDRTALVYPGAPELCDLWDNNCDGVRNEDPVDGRVWYFDGDGDGFGDPATEARACRGLAGHVANALDCDDGNASVRPRGLEWCDGLDNNCDGAVDNEPLDEPTWYADVDGDGLGDPGDALEACEAPSGYVAAGTDCDDADPAVDDTNYVLLPSVGTMVVESCWTERNCVAATWEMDPAGTFVSTTSSYVGTWTWDCTQSMLELVYQTGSIYLGLLEGDLAFEGPSAAPDGKEGGWVGTLTY